MGRFVIIVLDGFGIGAMDDVPQVRPADVGANTCRSIFRTVPELYLPNLEKLGLMNAAGFETERMKPCPTALYGKSLLTHFWADTFWGHQEIMGTKPVMPKGHTFRSVEPQVRAALENAGYSVRPYPTENGDLLIVNEAVTVGDNIECDPLQAINVTSAIDHIPFEEVVRIGHIVRNCCTTPRVIVFGGRGVGLSNLLNAVETPNGLAGVDAPKSGVYVRDYHCIHLGYGVDPSTQLPELLAEKGIPVTLIGKVADIVANPRGESYSIVDTPSVMAQTLKSVLTHPNGFVCTNVQETDLCGHRQDAKAYAEILRQADAGLGPILEALAPGDRLVIMADHGNDPLIGHPHHTRERVPLLIAGGTVSGFLGQRNTLSDVAATAAEYFGANRPQNGTSFLALTGKGGGV